MCTDLVTSTNLPDPNGAGVEGPFHTFPVPADRFVDLLHAKGVLILLRGECQLGAAFPDHHGDGWNTTKGATWV